MHAANQECSAKDVWFGVVKNEYWTIDAIAFCRRHSLPKRRRVMWLVPKVIVQEMCRNYPKASELHAKRHQESRDVGVGAPKDDLKLVKDIRQQAKSLVQHPDTECWLEAVRCTSKLGPGYSRGTMGAGFHCG